MPRTPCPISGVRSGPGQTSMRFEMKGCREYVGAALNLALDSSSTIIRLQSRAVDMEAAGPVCGLARYTVSASEGGANATRNAACGPGRRRHGSHQQQSGG